MNEMNTCRVCETTDRMQVMYKSEGNELLAMLNHIFPFPIKTDDCVPLRLCIECGYKLEFIYNFKTQYLNTCAKFRNILNTYSTQNEGTETVIYELLPNDDTSMEQANFKLENSYKSYITEEINNIHLLPNIPIKTEFGSHDNFIYQNLLQSGQSPHVENKIASIGEVVYNEMTYIPSQLDHLQSTMKNSDGSSTFFHTALYDSQSLSTYGNASTRPIPSDKMNRQTEVETNSYNISNGGIGMIHNVTIPNEGNQNRILEKFNKNNQLILEQSLQNINQQLPQTSNSPCYTCEYCGKLFDNPRGRRRHRLIHLGPRNIKCDHCGKLFRTLDRLKNHQVWDSCADPFKCNECGKVFIDFATLWEHFMWHRRTDTVNNDDNSLLVPLPDKPATNEEVKSNLFKCDFCGKAYTVSTNLRKHQRMHLNMRPFKCAHCERSFMTPSGLNVHQALHVNPELFKCDECGKTFTRAAALKIHQALHSNPHLFRCEECGKNCTTKFFLKRHMMSHSNSPFKCKQCGKVFKDLDTLRQHEDLHTNPDGFHCNECGKSFKRATNYKDHLELHSDPNKYGCNECGQTFTRPQTLKTHLALHKNPNLFACECGKAFRSIESLRYHKLSHLKEKSQNENIVKPLNSASKIVEPTENPV